MINQKRTILAGALFGLLGVAIGAFGAHALKATLLLNHSLDTYELAVRYQFYHAFALLMIGLFMEKASSKWLNYAAISMIIGTLFFSGSLYALAFKTGKLVAFITPIGGLFLISGWLFLLITFIRKK